MLLPRARQNVVHCTLLNRKQLHPATCQDLAQRTATLSIQLREASAQAHVAPIGTITGPMHATGLAKPKQDYHREFQYS